MLASCCRKLRHALLSARCEKERGLAKELV